MAAAKMDKVGKMPPSCRPLDIGKTASLLTNTKQTPISRPPLADPGYWQKRPRVDQHPYGGEARAGHGETSKLNLPST